MTIPSTQRPSETPDEVVLLDENGQPNGAADRMSIHTSSTPLHLAFSSYLFNGEGQVLVTRRALSKKTWPGVWTNSACGHPKPGEHIEDAVRRRIREELGMHVGPIIPVLPEFRYRAVDASGIVENEFCPVFVGFVGNENPIADPSEVAEWAWVNWADLHRAIESTPHVYSPWAALQVPEIEALFPGATSFQRRNTVDADAAAAEVENLISAELEALATEWRGHVGSLGLDVLGDDLPQWLSRLSTGGKRIRVRLAYWTFIAAGGTHGSEAYLRLLRVSAALEILHLFALIHDDVMDESDSRRGHPSAHLEAATWHRESRALGESQRFGESLAILLGDLAHTVADRLVEGLPARLRDMWFRLSVELIAGQRADLTGAAAGRWDQHHAEAVARLKTGRYTVMRPMQFGAIAAGASAEVEEALLSCGELLGRSFALRDDYLGVWGDPEVTGKPAGDDLVDAKATLLLTIARQRLNGAHRDMLNTLGTDQFSREDAPALAAAMQHAGVATELEQLIVDDLTAAMACLDDVNLVPAGLTGLRKMAQAVAWRDA